VGTTPSNKDEFFPEVFGIAGFGGNGWSGVSSALLEEGTEKVASVSLFSLDPESCPLQISANVPRIAANGFPVATGEGSLALVSDVKLRIVTFTKDRLRRTRISWMHFPCHAKSTRPKGKHQRKRPRIKGLAASADEVRRRLEVSLLGNECPTRQILTTLLIGSA
jgi:hypothetical protein